MFGVMVQSGNLYLDLNGRGWEVPAAGWVVRGLSRSTRRFGLSSQHHLGKMEGVRQIVAPGRTGGIATMKPASCGPDPRQNPLGPKPAYRPRLDSNAKG